MQNCFLLPQSASSGVSLATTYILLVALSGKTGSDREDIEKLG